MALHHSAIWQILLRSAAVPAALLLVLWKVQVAAASGGCGISVPDGSTLLTEVIDAVSVGKAPITLPRVDEAPRPPISLVGMSDSAHWTASKFNLMTVSRSAPGGRWTVTPTDPSEVKILKGDSATCDLGSIQISAVGRDKPYLQMQFPSCVPNSSSPVHLEIPLALASSDTEATGMGLQHWMSAISPDLFATVMAAGDHSDNQILAEFMNLLQWTEMGDGLCKSSSGGLTPVASQASSRAECQFQCTASIWKLMVSSSGSGDESICTGYSWSNSSGACTVFEGGWTVDGTEQEAGFTCYHPGVDTSQAREQWQASHGQAELDWRKLLGGRSSSLAARAMNVTSSCLSAFEWYTLDRPLLLTVGDWQTVTDLLAGVAGNYAAQSALSASLLMDSVCVRDLDGNLGGACASEDNEYYQSSFMCVSGGTTITDCEAYMKTEQGGSSSESEKLLGACFSDALFLLPLALAALLILLLGCCCGRVGKIVFFPETEYVKIQRIEEPVYEPEKTKTERFWNALGMSS